MAIFIYYLLSRKLQFLPYTAAVFLMGVGIGELSVVLILPAELSIPSVDTHPLTIYLLLCFFFLFLFSTLRLSSVMDKKR